MQDAYICHHGRLDIMTDWSENFTLGEAEDGMYQSVLSKLRGDGVTVALAHKRLRNKMRNELEEEWNDKKDSVEHALVSRMFGEMVASERQLWNQDYFVFYRVVGGKYVLYQFHTLMLSLFHPGGQDHNGLICTPSLDDSIYPSSLGELLNMFRNKTIKADSQTLTSNVLISVNNSLTPSEIPSRRLHSGLTHEMEASPLNYYEGYDETNTYVEEMERFMREFFGLAPDVSVVAVRAMFELYHLAHQRRDTFTGHCLQICLPYAALQRFAYPCVSWGQPVTLWLDQDDKLHVFDVHGPASPTDFKRQLSLAEVLRRPELCELQTRILAHPNLFLTAGAFTRVFHANPGFDEEGFKAKLRVLLGPLIIRGLTIGTKVTFKKFCV